MSLAIGFIDLYQILFLKDFFPLPRVIRVECQPAFSSHIHRWLGKRRKSLSIGTSPAKQIVAVDKNTNKNEIKSLFLFTCLFIAGQNFIRICFPLFIPLVVAHQYTSCIFRIFLRCLREFVSYSLVPRATLTMGSSLSPLIT